MSQNPARVRTELMSPVGHWPQLSAAIENGADAVYFGLNHFSARAKVGFDPAELSTVMQTLRRRGVKGYLTFNTLVFDSEIEEAIDAIKSIVESGVDAIIVQDVGIAKIISELAPDFPIHGSTQMSVTSAEGCELAKSFGCSRVVLARELSLNDIRKIKSQTDVELEVFVHGALCVSYSGQCFSSEAWGGRSANRGQCAQACRLSYELIVDGKHRDLGPARYLLSPGDLMALQHVPQLVELGVSCLKIEGRYKDAAYVAAATRAYREAIDAAVQKREPENVDHTGLVLEQIYSRGLGDYFVSGTNHQKVVVGRAPRHRGVRVGTVTKVLRDSVIIECKHPLVRGDGVVFDAADRRSPDIREQGGFVYDVRDDGENLVRAWFSRETVDIDDIRAGDWVWRTADMQLEKKLRPMLDPKSPIKTLPVHFELEAILGQKLRIRASLESGQVAQSDSEQTIEHAKTNPTTHESVLAQISRLGGTQFHLGSHKIGLSADAFVPTSLLNQIRRQVIEQLEACMLNRNSHQLNEISSNTKTILFPSIDIPIDTSAGTLSVEIHLLVRTPEQLSASIALSPASITLDYLELYGLRRSVEQVQQAGIEVRVASPRILKPTEQNVIKFLLSLETPILVRSGGLLQDLLTIDSALRPPIDGDFSLNIANRMSATSFRNMGLRRMAPTHDLNAQQIVDLAGYIPANELEIVALHHLPVFHMEHCVFCRFLSDGTDNTNCGHPCEKHRIAVADHQGRQHPVMADVGCRNTVFGAEMQSAALHLPELISAGIRHLRLEFVHQSANDVETAIVALRSYLAGDTNTFELEPLWEKTCPAGVTEGSLFVPRNLVQLK